MQNLELRISGRVQGVFFRQSAYDEAVRLGLYGTVQNLSDGRVEIHAEGTEANLNALVNWCKEGPANAEVEKVEVIPGKIKNYLTFKII